MAGIKVRNLLLLTVASAVVSACLPTASSVGGGGSPIPVEDNSPPVISGSPATQVMAGTTYLFQPSATDGDGDTLTFSASGLPSWASIDTRTGAVQGSPTNTHVGTTSDIVIRASDGTAVATLPAFRITVMATQTTPPVTTGTAALSWTMPTQHTDGTPLAINDLLGYRVYHGPNATSLSQYHDIDGAGTTTYEARQLAPGDHCFAVTAISVSNVESALSGVGCKRI